MSTRLDGDALLVSDIPEINSAEPDEPSPPKSKSTASELEFLARMQAADAVAERELQLFGRVAKVVRPFSLQLKQELRDAYPEDKDIYDKADMLQQSAASNYRTLRAVTFAFFAAFMAIVVTLSTLHSSLRAAAAFDSLTYLSWLENGVALNLAIATVALVFYVLRKMARAYWLYNVIQNQVSQLAYALGQKQNQLERELASASGRIELRQDANLPNLSWPERAFGSAKILLWFAKRLEALDRYATTVMWKMDVFDERLEWLTWLSKGALLALFVLILMSDPKLHSEGTYPNWSILGASLVSVVAFAVIWVWSDRADTDYWKQVLLREVHPDAKGKAASGHYFNIVAVRVQNLVAQIMQALRVPGSQSGGSGRSRSG